MTVECMLTKKKANTAVHNVRKHYFYYPVCSPWVTMSTSNILLVVFSEGVMFKQEPPGGGVLTSSPYSTHLSDSLFQYQIHFVAKTKLVSAVTDEGVERRRIGLKLQVIFWKSISSFPVEKLRGKSLKLTEHFSDLDLLQTGLP